MTEKDEATSVEATVSDIDAAIESLLDDHSNPNWDGEGADGLRSETVSVARAVAKGLPYISGPDDVCATPKGEVDISWFFSLADGTSCRLISKLRIPQALHSL